MENQKFMSVSPLLAVETAPRGVAEAILHSRGTWTPQESGTEFLKEIFNTYLLVDDMSKRTHTHTHWDNLSESIFSRKLSLPENHISYYVKK